MLAKRLTRIASASLIAALTAALATAQNPAAPAPPARGGRGPAAPQFVSPEVGADRRVTFRVHAPQRQAVRLSASDIPNLGQAATMTKADNCVWSTTVEIGRAHV